MWAALAAFPIAAGGAAQAQGGSVSELAAREQLDVAARAQEEGDWESAREALRRAYALKPSPDVRLELARAQARTGHLVEAAEGLRTYLDESASAADAEERAELRRELQALEERIPRLRPRLGGLQEGDRLFLDGEGLPREAAGIALPVNPGSHRLRVQRGEAVVAEIEVTLEEGAKRDVELAVSAVESESPPESSAQPGTPAVPQDEPLRVREPGSAQDAPTPAAGTAQSAAGTADEPIQEKWWFWVLMGGLVLGGGVAFLALSGDPSPVEGNFGPGVVEVR